MTPVYTCVQTYITCKNKITIRQDLDRNLKTSILVIVKRYGLIKSHRDQQVLIDFFAFSWRTRKSSSTWMGKTCILLIKHWRQQDLQVKKWSWRHLWWGLSQYCIQRPIGGPIHSRCCVSYLVIRKCLSFLARIQVLYYVPKSLISKVSYISKNWTSFCEIKSLSAPYTYQMFSRLGINMHPLTSLHHFTVLNCFLLWSPQI